MSEENTKAIDNVDGEAVTVPVKSRRLEIYMQITAAATSMIVLSIVALLVYYIRSIVIIFALAFLAAYVLGPAVRFFEGRGINRVLIVSILYVVFVAMVVVSVLLLLPLLWSEVNELRINIQNSLSDPQFGETVKAGLQNIEARLVQAFPQLENVNLGKQLNIEEGATKGAYWILGRMGAIITTYTGKLIWLIVAMIITPIITFFLLKDGERIRRAAMKVIPSKHSEIALELLQKVDRQIGRYIRGRLAESIILSVLTILGLLVLDVKYYLVIGGIAGFANLIPYIGPVGISIPAVILAAYQHGAVRMVATGLFLGGLQVVDNAIIVPLVVGKSVDLHPIVTIFVIFVGGQLLGFLGMIVAVPLTSITISVSQALYKDFRNLSTPA
ncbi:AI-2E family transporter [Candidatus Poribacteria bacterium]